MLNTDTDHPDLHALRTVLLAAREAGFLGPGSVERHFIHAEGFVALARSLHIGESARVLDLGSGGGLPGLVLATQWPTTSVVLLEANERRARFLLDAVVSCRLEERVTVVHQRAELCGRDPLYRGNFHGVVARSFGAPAVVAECAAPLLRENGWLIVSEPPVGPEGGANPSVIDVKVDTVPTVHTAGVGRWPAQQLVQLGLEPVEFVTLNFGYQILRQRTVCPERFPRRNGVPAKRPLF